MVDDGGGGEAVVVTGGAANVWVVVAVVTAVVLAAPEVVVLVDVVVWVAVALVFSGGTGTAVPGRATVACPAPPASLAASDPVCAGAEVDFTALPIPKPAATAITINAPSSHHRRSILPPSLRPVPVLIVVGMATVRAASAGDFRHAVWTRAGSVPAGPVAQSVRAADS